jgi:dTDP-4-dehydrorhamnose 3,5-epimerase
MGFELWQEAGGGPMKLIETELAHLWIIEPISFEDHRGFFLESYNRRKFQEHGIDIEFKQDNHSLSVSTGTLRGLHYQLAPKAQTKLVRVLAGSIFDVAVDLRAESETFGQWVGVILSSVNKRQLLIPKGFAHGFYTLEPNTEVAYKVDEYYSQEHDRGIHWNDPDIGIRWPTNTPILSKKDEDNPNLHEVIIESGELKL